MNKSSKTKKEKVSKVNKLILAYDGPKGKFYEIQRNSECNAAIIKMVEKLIINNSYNSIQIQGSGNYDEIYYPGANLVFTDPPVVSSTSPVQFLNTLNVILSEAYQFGSYVNCRKIQNVTICLTSSIQFKSAVGNKQFIVQITDMKTKLYEKLKSVANR